LHSLLLAGSVLLTTCGSLCLEFGLTLNLSLLFVDGLDEHILVLVLVTLGGGVHAMVHALVNFPGVTILTEKATEDTGAAHPDELSGHTSILSTLSATLTVMATSALSGVPRLCSGA